MVTINRAGVCVVIGIGGDIAISPWSDEVFRCLLRALRVEGAQTEQVHGSREARVVSWASLDGRDGIVYFGSEEWSARVTAIRRVLTERANTIQ